MPSFDLLLLVGVALIVIGAVAVAVRPMSGRKNRVDGDFRNRDALRD